MIINSTQYPIFDLRERKQRRVTKNSNEGLHNSGIGISYITDIIVVPT
jgi:hypothetical protein